MLNRHDNNNVLIIGFRNPLHTSSDIDIRKSFRWVCAAICQLVEVGFYRWIFKNAKEIIKVYSRRYDGGSLLFGRKNWARQFIDIIVSTLLAGRECGVWYGDGRYRIMHESESGMSLTST